MDSGVSGSQVGNDMGDSRLGRPRAPQIGKTNASQDEVDEELSWHTSAPEPPPASSRTRDLPFMNNSSVRPQKYGGPGISSASAQDQANPGLTVSVSANPIASARDVRELRPTFSPRIVRTPDHYRTGNGLLRSSLASTKPAVERLSTASSSSSDDNLSTIASVGVVEPMELLSPLMLDTPFPPPEKPLGDRDRTAPDTEINTLASMLASILEDTSSRRAIPEPAMAGHASENVVASLNQPATLKRHVVEDGIPSFSQRVAEEARAEQQHSRSSTSRSRSTSASSQSRQQGYGYTSHKFDATFPDDETEKRSLRRPRTHNRESSLPKNPHPSTSRYQSVDTHTRPSNGLAANNPYDWRPDHTGQGHNPNPYRSLVRQGYWNKRGDHLTPSGHVVYAPPDRAYPHELASYPPQDFRNETGMIASWTDRPQLPESMPTRNGPPLRPYEQ
ncbi:hypothetical protein AAF712_016253, partial [Marasmius tenuissimus]